MAGLIGESSSTRRGLQPVGMGFTNDYRYIDPGAYVSINCAGFLFLRVPYSWSGFELWYCSDNVAVKLAGTTYSIGMSVTSSNGVVTIENTVTARRGVQLTYQSIPKLNG